MDCNGCGMCCYICDVPWLNKPPSVWCKHYIPDVGCGIWGEHPQECKDFTCWYYDSKNLPEDINPKNCRCIIEKYDDIFLVTTDPENFDSWQNVGDFIDQVRKIGYSIVITSYADKRRFVITKKGKSQEIMDRVKELAREEYGIP